MRRLRRSRSSFPSTFLRLPTSWPTPTSRRSTRRPTRPAGRSSRQISRRYAPQYTEGALIFGVRVPLELAPGEKYPPKLASLRGTIPYVVEQAAESWVIEDPQNAVNVVRDTLLEKLTFVGAKSGQNPGTYLFHSDPKTPEELKVLGNCDAEQRALLINSGGGACRTRGVDYYGGGNFEVSFVDDRGPLVPAILIVRVPTKIERRELKFEFKDVPLP